jgi:hypothetical protein
MIQPESTSLQAPNLRSALDARTALRFHVEAHRPGASESDRYQNES